jgi:NADH-quinone oxidoreductase subunit M
MILVWLIVTFLAGGLLAWLAARWNSRVPFWISLCTVAAECVLTVILWFRYAHQVVLSNSSPWLIEINYEWIPQLGINFHLALDSLSLILVSLTAFLGVMSVVSSWTEIRERIGFYHLNLMAILAGIVGVFLAMDLFLFYFFWELMLVPMYFLIAIWGHENRTYASIKFFIFTQLSGLLMLAAILGLYFYHGHSSGAYTFDYMQLLGTPLSSFAARWLFFGFLIAFAVKLPVVPVHSWLPDAHTEAPTAGSVILAGLLLKTGAYGMLRFAVPLFPQAAFAFSTTGMVLGIIGILYGAMMAFSQTDLKRLVAYTSISHMGFVFLGIFVWNTLALQGVILQLVCHGLSTGALFMIVGSLQERIHTRDMERMGGLWTTVPRMGGVAMFFALASLGLPGLGNFVAEFLILLGTYYASITMTAIATAGLVTATVYSLWIMHVAFFGKDRGGWKIRDLSLREMAAMTVMMLALLWLGLYPQPLLNSAERSLEVLQQSVHGKMALADPAADAGKTIQSSGGTDDTE